MAPALDELIIGDEPAAWRQAGFAVDDHGTCPVGDVRLRLEGTASGRGMRMWALRDIADDGVIDGLHTVARATASPPRRRSPDPHPNGVTALDHVVVMTPDLDRTVGALRMFGLVPRRTREAGTPERPLRQTFFRLGEPILEVVGPPPGDGPAEVAGPPAGPEPGRTRVWGLAFTVADLDATADRLGSALGRPREAVQPGRRIATLRTGDEISLAVAFLSPPTPR